MALVSFLDGGANTPNQVVRIGGRLGGHRVLLPILAVDADALTDQIRVGSTLVRSTGGTLDILDPRTTPEHTFEMDRPQDEGTDRALDWARDRIDEEPAELGAVFGGRRVERRVRETLRNGEYDTVVLPRGVTGGPLSRRRLRKLARQAPCNVISVNGQAGFREFASILLPIANGPHSGLATDVAGSIADQLDAYVDILHVIPPDADESQREAAVERTETAAERIDLPETASTWILEGESVASTIVTQSAYYGLTVIGAPTVGPLHRFVYGSTSRSIRDGAESAVIAVRTPAGP